MIQAGKVAQPPENVPSTLTPTSIGQSYDSGVTMSMRVSQSTALGKAFAVLAAFDCNDVTRGVSDLARELGLPKGTVHRILAELVEVGFVDRTPGGRYQIGMRLFELGTLATKPAVLRNAALPYLHALYHATDFTVYLTVLDGLYAVHLERLPAKHRPEIDARWGGRWSLHCSSVGKVLLAYSPPDLFDDYTSRPLRSFTPFSIRDRHRLRKHIDQVRADGYATSEQEAILGVYGVAAPVFDGNGSIVASAAVAGHERTVLRFKSHTVRTASAITQTVAGRLTAERRR